MDGDAIGGFAYSDEIISEIRQVYQDCWNEYYEWEPQYCTERLRSLKLGQDADVTTENALLDDLGWNLWDTELQEWEVDEKEGSVSKVVATKSVKIQNERNFEVKEHQIPCYRTSLSNFPPVPPYEFCTRLTECRAASLDSEEYREIDRYDEKTGEPIVAKVLWIYFCPLVDADEPFPEATRQTYLESAVLSWENDRDGDNDVQVIIMETVSRLHERQFPIEHIDAASVFPEAIFLPKSGSIVALSHTWKFRSVILTTIMGEKFNLS
ncbi:hypothetical protein FRC17_001046 [Serendipita sp. 399]|nr:hypothetical protein FRC17_001046 [Serendipita sp. 399]